MWGCTYVCAVCNVSTGLVLVFFLHFTFFHIELPPPTCSLIAVHVHVMTSTVFLIDHQVLFQHLDSVKGTVEERKKLVEHVVKEATKFKKKQLIEQLEEWSNNLSSLRTMSSDLKGRPAAQSQRR